MASSGYNATMSKFFCNPIFPVHPFWVDGDYFSHIMPVMMGQYIIFTLMSQLIHRGLGRHLHQTRFISNILTAVIMGPTLMARSKYVYWVLSPSSIQMMPQNRMTGMGITLYVFISAVKIDCMYMIKQAGNKALKIFIPSVILSSLVTLITTRYLRIYVDKNLPGSFANGFISFTLVFGSSLNLVTALSELNLMSSETARFAICTSVITELVKWSMMAIVKSAYKENLRDSIVFLISVSLMASFCVWVLRPWAKWIIDRTPKDQPVSDSCVVNFILVAMVMESVSGIISGNPLVGPFLFGLCVPSGPPLGSTLVKTVEQVAEEILLPFFYIELGSNLNLPAVINSKTFYLVGVVVFLGSITKFIAMVLSSRLCGFNTCDSLKIGLALNFTGLVTAHNFERLRNPKVLLDFNPKYCQYGTELINPQTYTSLIISSTLINTILTPLVKILHHKEIQKGKSTAGHLDNINPQMSIQKSRKDLDFRVITCVYDESNVAPITRLLEISNRTTKTVASSVSTYVIHISQLDEGEAAPFFGPHFNHTRICHHNGCDKILSAFSNYTRFSKEQVIIMPFTAISPYKTMHEEICRMAIDKNVPLIILPFYKNNNTPNSVNITINQAVGLTSVYNRIKRHAQCTVGFLFDKPQSFVTQSLPVRLKRFPQRVTNYNVVVIFIAGADDREALAYGLRMLGHSGLDVTLLHIHMTNEEWEFTYHDEDMVLLEEFKILSHETTNNATYNDIVVDNWEKAMQAIKQLVDEYNLVIVGQRQRSSSSIWLQEEMMEWMENPELGLIGDMLVSANFYSRVMSVLVLHHHDQHVEYSEKISGL